MSYVGIGSNVEIQSRAKIWKSGLLWYNGDGIGTLVDVVDTSKVVLCMQCKSEDYLQLLQHRSAQIKQIRRLQQEICPSLKCGEFFIHSSCIQDCFKIKDDKLIPMNDIYRAINKGEKYVVTNHGYYGVTETILFDPYTQLCRKLVDAIINHQLQILPKEIKYLTDHLCSQYKLFIKLLNISVTSLPPDSAAELGEQEQGRRLMDLLRLWKAKTGGSLEDLKIAFDSISVFAALGMLLACMSPMWRKLGRKAWGFRKQGLWDSCRRGQMCEGIGRTNLVRG